MSVHQLIVEARNLSTKTRKLRQDTILSADDEDALQRLSEIVRQLGDSPDESALIRLESPMNEVLRIFREASRRIADEELRFIEDRMRKHGLKVT